MIERWRAQRSFGDGLIAAEVADLYEAWMRQADRVLDDPQIIPREVVYSVTAAFYVKFDGHLRRGRF